MADLIREAAERATSIYGENDYDRQLADAVESEFRPLLEKYERLKLASIAWANIGTNPMVGVDSNCFYKICLEVRKSIAALEHSNA